MSRQKTAATLACIALFFAPIASFGMKIDPTSSGNSTEAVSSGQNAGDTQGQGTGAGQGTEDSTTGQGSENSQGQGGQDMGQGDTVQEQQQDRDQIQDGTGDQAQEREQEREMTQEELGDGNGQQVQNQEQTQTEEQAELGISDEEKSQRSINRRNQIANAMQEIEKVAAANGETGEQLRVMAQNQNNDQDTIENALERAQNRNSVVKFLIGPNYGKLNEVEGKVQEQQNRIQEMEQLANQLQNEGDRQAIMEQIQIMNEVKAELEQELDIERQGFSLFGWLFRWLA